MELRSRTGRLCRVAAAVWIAGSLLAPAAGAGLGYYGQAIRGGLEIRLKARGIERLLAEGELEEPLRERLELVLEIREFASAELGLPDNASYRRYTDLGRPYAVWTVVAAGELSVVPEVWCFPIAGCVSYRGYFDEKGATRFAERLAAKGYDVDVGGVTTYSTLGWLADPVLNTFVDLPEPALAGLLFHELAHQRLYVKDSTVFNESFATAVELAGVERWLEHVGRPEETAAYRRTEQREAEFVDLVLEFQGLLAAVYGEEREVEWKRQRKAELLAELGERYQELRADWGGYPGYDAWFEQDVNNAHLAAIGAYHLWVPAFEDLLASAGGDLEELYAAAERFADLEPAAREAAIEALLESAARRSSKRLPSPPAPGVH